MTPDELFAGLALPVGFTLEYITGDDTERYYSFRLVYLRDGDTIDATFGLGRGISLDSARRFVFRHVAAMLAEIRAKADATKASQAIRIVC